jgi:hypothetical protein
LRNHGSQSQSDKLSEYSSNFTTFICLKTYFCHLLGLFHNMNEEKSHSIMLQPKILSRFTIGNYNISAEQKISFNNENKIIIKDVLTQRDLVSK